MTVRRRRVRGGRRERDGSAKPEWDWAGRACSWQRVGERTAGFGEFGDGGDGWRGAGGGGSLLQKLLAKTRWPNAATGVWCEEKFQRRG